MCVSQFFYFIYILISFAITFSIPVGFLPGKGGFPYQVYFYLCLHQEICYYAVNIAAFSFLYVLFHWCRGIHSILFQRVERLELTQLVWKTRTLPLSYTRKFKKQFFTFIKSSALSFFFTSIIRQKNCKAQCLLHWALHSGVKPMLHSNTAQHQLWVAPPRSRASATPWGATLTWRSKAGSNKAKQLLCSKRQASTQQKAIVKYAQHY